MALATGSPLGLHSEAEGGPREAARPRPPSGNDIFLVKKILCSTGYPDPSRAFGPKGPIKIACPRGHACVIMRGDVVPPNKAHTRRYTRLPKERRVRPALKL